MAAILAIQSLVFQDGGILALGANVLNMAVFGVLAGYLPFHLWGSGRWRRAAIFGGGALSVLVSAVLALGELLLSGVRMPASVLGLSIALFLRDVLKLGPNQLSLDCLPYGRRRLIDANFNFPRFDRNLNTGGNNYDETTGAIAHNVVHHSQEYPSSVTITVVKK